MEISIAPEYESIPAGKEVDMHVMITLKSPAVESGTERSPISLCLVIDRSGSMEGEKIETTREAARYIINWLTRRDFASIVTYDSNVRVVVPFQQLTHKPLVMEEIRKITTHGCTNLSGGWLRGLSSLEENYRPGNIHRLILLTDGQANEGIIETGKLASMADFYRQKGITSTTLGFGEGFNDELLQSIAGAGGGNFHFVADGEKMAGAFLSEFGDIYKVIGQNMELTVTAADTVGILECLSDYLGAIDGNTATFNLGDVYSEETKFVIFKLRVPAAKVNGKVPFMKASVRYDSVDGEFGVRKASETMEHPAAGGGDGSLVLNPDVRREVIIERLAKARYRVSELMEKGDVKDAIAVVKEHIALIGQQEERVVVNLGPEKRNLNDLLDRLKLHGADRTLKKHVSTTAYSSTSRGRSVFSFPNERRVRAEMLRKDQERISEFGEQVETLMAQYRYRDKTIQDMVFILNELFSNAVEYGALWCEDRPIKVECRISIRYVKCVVEDQGPGFDFVKTLADLERSSDKLRDRGRGLLTVRELADKLHFRERGNCVEALIYKKLTSIDGRSKNLRHFQVGDADVLVVPVPADGLSNQGCIAFMEKMIQLFKDGLKFAVLDLGAVDYAASVGLGLLAYLLNCAREAGGDLVLANANDLLTRLFKVVQFNHLFKIVRSPEEALALLEKDLGEDDEA